MNGSLQDTGYRHWHGTVRNVWARRAVVARQTMQSCLRGRIVRFLVVAAWVLSLATACVFFAIGQVLVPNGLLQPLIDLMGQKAQQVALGVSAWLALYPDITIRAASGFLLLHLCGLLQTLSFLVIAIITPRLLTRDLAGNAVVIYASRAISRFDYLFGKLAGLLGVLSLCWLGPMLAAWFVGNAVAPDWSFFWHSRAGLIHTLLAVVPTMLATALLALGISAVSAKARVTVGIWLVIWLLTPALVPVAGATRPWLATLSFGHDVDRFTWAIFKPYEDFMRARESLPFFNTLFKGLDPEKVETWAAASLTGPAVGLLLATSLSVVILLRRIRTR